MEVHLFLLNIKGSSSLLSTPSHSSSPCWYSLSISLLLIPDACRPPRLAALAKRGGFFLRVGVAIAPTGSQCQSNIDAMTFFADLKKLLSADHISAPSFHEMGQGENMNEKCSLVLCSAETQDGLHHLVSIQLFAQRTRDAGCGAVGATAEETYQIL